MAITYSEQIVVARASGVNSLTSGSITIAANSLVVICSSIFNASGSAVTITDSGGQTYSSAIEHAESGGSGNSQVKIHYKENHPGGAITVTVNPTGAVADIDFTISEIHGPAATPLDNTATNGETGAPPSTDANVASGALDQNSEIIFAIVGWAGNDGPVSVDSTYTQIGENESGADGNRYNAQYKIVNTTASDTANWTMTGSGLEEWYCALATFMESNRRWFFGAG